MSTRAVNAQYARGVFGEKPREYTHNGTSYRLKYLDASGIAAPESVLHLCAARAQGPQPSLEQALSAFARASGFDSYSFGALFRGVPIPTMAVSTPLPLRLWLHYHDRGLMAYDEAIIHCSTHSSPALFHMESSQLARRVPDVADQLCAAGLATRLVFPIHGGSLNSMVRATGMMALNSARRLDRSAHQLVDVMARGQLIATYLLDFLVELSPFKWPDELGGPRLTRRESELLSYAAKGATTKEIALLCDVSERTVLFHFGNLFAKLGVHTRVEAISEAYLLGLLNTSGAAFSESQIAGARQSLTAL